MHFVLCDEKRDIDIRIMCGESILGMLEKLPINITKPMISPIVPGLLDNFSEASIKDGTSTNSNIVMYCLNLIENVIMITYEDWIDKRGSQFEVIMKRIISHLTMHKKFEVREKLINLLENIEKILKNQFAPITNIFLEVCINLYNDENKKIKDKVKRIISSKLESNKSLFIKHFTSQLNISLDEISLRMVSSKTKNQIDISRILIRIHNLIIILGPSYISTILSFSTKLIDNITSILTINTSKISIICEEDNVIYKDSMNFYNEISFENNISNELILNICEVLVQSGNTKDLFNNILDLINISDVDKKISYFIFCFGLILKLKSNDEGQYNYSLLLILEVSIEILKRYEDKFQVKEQDEEINIDIIQSNNESFFISLLLVICSEVISRLHSKLEHVDLLTDYYYTLLVYTSSNDSSICQAGVLSLNNVSNQNFYNSIHSLVYKTNCNLKDYNNCSKAANVLSVLLHHLKDRRDCSINLYNETKYIIEDILLTIDHGNQTRIFNILKTIYSFTKACNIWFVEIKCIEEKENEDEEVLPEEIKLVHKILTRTKNLILSNYLPIQVITFDIMKEGLLFCKNFRRKTLPIIYGNWQGIKYKITILKKEYNECLKNPIMFLVAAKAISIISHMTIFSDTFMYGKMREIIDSIHYSMIETLKKSYKADPVYCYSQMFEYQKTVLISIPIFVKYFEISSKDDLYEPLFDICKRYSCDIYQPTLLKEEATKATKCFLKY
uniref:Non-specific serine/threonine protein kinase n=1 Tax=Parastrongyloides trichosuri TaxID=131310 RepID=A0A0N4Z113_PARTI